MSDYESDEEFSTIYSCSICDASNMELDRFLQHTKRHTSKERTALLNRLVSDTALANMAARSAAAAFGFKQQPSVKSSVPLYICVVCGQGNLMLKSLSEHSSLHPKNMESHYCNLCQQHFQDETYLKTHLETHLDSNDLLCQYCNQRFNIIDDLELHESCHQRAEFVCVECCEKFVSKHFVLAHLKESHSNGLVCDICVQEFKSESLLNNHIITHTTVSSIKSLVEMFPCDICGKKYDSKIALQRHNLFVHNKRMPLLCELCGFPTYHQDSLREHLVKDHSDVTLTCAQCDVLFFKKVDLDKHMDNHAEHKMFICKFCGCRFRKLDNFNFHLKLHDEKGSGDSHSRIKSHRTIVCSLCGISFDSDSDLNHHLHNVHHNKCLKLDSKTSGLPFECAVCSASFRLEFELDEHTKNHTFYQCHLCLEEFVHDIQLQTHLESSHKEETSGNV